MWIIERATYMMWMAFSEAAAIRSADAIDASKMDLFKTFHLALLERGVYVGPSGYEVGFLSTAHTEADIDRLAETLGRALRVGFSETALKSDPELLNLREDPAYHRLMAGL